MCVSTPQDIKCWDKSGMFSCRVKDSRESEGEGEGGGEEGE